MAKPLNCLLLIISAFTLLLGTAFAPAFTEFTFLRSVDIQGKFLGSDLLRQAYVIDNTNKLYRFDSTGIAKGTFYDAQYGKLSFVDAGSPFNILLFYPDKSTVLMLDNQLNPKHLYKFPTMDINDVSAACLSSDNYVWFYDTKAGKLKKINTQYEIIQESLDLNQLFGENIRPNFLTEYDRRVYMNIPDMGIIVFDMYGNYYTSIPVAGLEHFQVIKDNIVYFSEGKLQLLSWDSDFKVKSMAIPNTEAIKNVRLESGRLYILDQKSLQVYASADVKK
ncbi:MAG: hypothetical protein IPL35_07320 [Sphingobacteriales bacterium]|nr:hypothetical protein [Sphingobacteriales bacterium]